MSHSGDKSLYKLKYYVVCPFHLSSVIMKSISLNISRVTCVNSSDLRQIIIKNYKFLRIVVDISFSTKHGKELSEKVNYKNNI